MKILFHPKDHPFRTESGYGIAARYLINGLFRDFELGVFAPIGQKYKLEYYFPELGVIGYDEPSFTLVTEKKEEYYSDVVVPIYPGIGEDYGEGLVEEHYQNFNAEILWQIADAWALTRIPELARQDRIRWVIQPPVDFLEPLPPNIVEKLSPAMKVVPWVNDGKTKLEKAGLKNVTDPIPLGVNTELWYPRLRSDYPQAMRDLGFSMDTFNIAIVAANQYGRKSWEQTLRGIKTLKLTRPEIDIRLYIHTNMQIGDGWPMSELLNYLGLAEITRNPLPYNMIIGNYSEFQLMLVHALADVVINAGLEGFGLGTIQAQAVGTPVIGLNAGATPELVNVGMLVPKYNEWLSPNLLKKADPHPQHIADSLSRIYETPRKEFEQGVKFVQDNFSWTRVCDLWRKLLNEVDQELEDKCIKTERYPPHPSERALEMSKEMIQIA